MLRKLGGRRISKENKVKDVTKSSLRSKIQDYNETRNKILEGLAEYGLLDEIQNQSFPGELTIPKQLDQMTQADLNAISLEYDSAFDTLQIVSFSIFQKHKQHQEAQLRRESISNLLKKNNVSESQIVTKSGGDAGLTEEEFLRGIVDVLDNKQLLAEIAPLTAANSSTSTATSVQPLAKSAPKKVKRPAVKAEPQRQKSSAINEEVFETVGDQQYLFTRLQLMIDKENEAIKAYNAALIVVKAEIGDSPALNNLTAFDELPNLPKNEDWVALDINKQVEASSKKRLTAQAIVDEATTKLHAKLRAEKKQQKLLEVKKEKDMFELELIDRMNRSSGSDVVEEDAPSVSESRKKEPLPYDPFQETDFTEYRKVILPMPVVSAPSRPTLKKNKKEPLKINATQIHLLPILEEVDVIKKLFIAYSQYCQKNQKSGIFDAQSAIYLCGMERKLLKIYEKLLVNSRSSDSSHIFENDEAISMCRNITKYLYVDFLCNNNSDSIKLLVTFTDTTLRDALSAKLYTKQMDKISLNDIPKELQQLLLQQNKPVDLSLMDARYKSILNIIHALNRQHEEYITGDLVYKKPGQELARALFFCLALAGLMTKHAFLPAEYSESIEKMIGADNAGNSHRLFAKTNKRKTTRLLSSLEMKLKSGNQAEKNAATLAIEQLTAIEMAKLLVEICNLESHETKGAWSHMGAEVIDLIHRVSQKFEELHTLQGDLCFSYANHSGLAFYAKQKAHEINGQIEKALFSEMAKSDNFFKSMQQVIDLLQQQDFLSAKSEAKVLMENNHLAFTTFSNRYLWGPTAQLLTKVQKMFGELFDDEIKVDREMQLGVTLV